MSTHNDIYCSIKMLVCLLSVLSLVMVFCGGYELDNCTLEAVKHPLYFLGFFPCSPDSNKDINECDMLTLSAVELAITLNGGTWNRMTLPQTVLMIRYWKL